ncbi:hypothetical protein CH275_09395 [Rhodococcus sp. 06-235-1A]|uniref:LysM peptidoglycan-binding domain-containing protein n=1 Tax=Rhodococcus sp. 06-235-1A TaxID=2022508 RepID=UPI000B9BB765|nr:LysM peptidoglycan-binding domain-containing protein [Rhodococcus sp. 06-235-1A]OZD06430.1 hypothetical protein CH275_09395 [Rhodococcus sp. 06-235-1A]
MTTIRRRLTGLLYLIVLLVLVVGLPFALWTFRGNPIPTTLPDLNQIKTALTTQDDGSLFLGFVTWIGWLAWATFTFSTVIELVAALRGIKAPQLRGLGFQQRSASVLIGGALMLVTAGTATAQPLTATALPLFDAPAHSAPIQVTQQSQPHPAEAPARPINGETITVQQGDSLWKLAERHLGDGFRYTEIKQLNADVLTDDGWLQPGWKLQLPAAAPTTVDGAYTVREGDSLWSIAEQHLGDGHRYKEIINADGTGPSTIIHVGQQLTVNDQTAETGTPEPAPVAAAPVPAAVPDPTVAPEPAPAAAPKPAPAAAPEPSSAAPLLGGTDVPEQAEMVPGGDEQAQAEAQAAAAVAAKIFGIELNSASSQLPAPTAAAPEPTPAPVAAPEPAEAPAPAAVPEPAPAPVAAPEPAEAPAPVAASDPAAESAGADVVAPGPAPAQMPAPAQASSPSPAAAPAPTQPATQIPLNTPTPDPVHIAATAQPSDVSENQNSTLWLGISVLAAIGLAGAFGLRRHRQQHDRRRGETLPETWGAAAVVEEQIHSAADNNVLTRLDEALRTIAEHARTQGNALPALLGAFIGPDAVELVILDDSVLPDPWLRSETGAWTLPADVRIAPAPTTISPYPTLVTLGSTDDRTQVLLNLEELGYLGVSASLEHARGTLQALALELVESPLADNLHLTLIGFGQELPELFGNGRIEHTDQPDEVLARLARQAERDQDTLVEQHIDSIAAARSIYDTSEMTAPEVVLIASQLTADQQQSLDQILAATPRVAFAAASTASENTQAAWTLDIVDRNTASLVKRDTDGGFAFQPAFLEPDQYEGITAYLATATQPAIPTESSIHDPWAAAEIDAHLTDAESAETFLDSVTAVDPTDHLLLNGTTASETAADVTDVPTYSPDAAQWTSPEAIRFDDQAPAIASVAGDVPASGHLWLHLLGKPAVTTLTGEPPKDGREVLLTEIAALLSIHPGIKHDSIDKKIWPADNFDKLPLEHQPKKKATRRQNYLSRLRNWLGETENGEQAFPKHGDRTGRTGYRLHPDVRSDWDYWQQLIDTTPAAATDAELWTAAELVNDQPFAGTRADRYGWARNLQQHMISTLADALEELATRQIKTGDLSAALTTANRGVTVEPFREGLWRLAIIATHGSDEISKTQELIDQLLANLADIDVDPEPETDELLRALAQFHNGGNALYRIGAIAS